jgi:hypothetical protein
VTPPEQRAAFPPPPPTPEQVVLLQAVADYPAVSVLVSTTPAPVMTPADAARLRGRVAEAVERVRRERLGERADHAVRALQALAGRASQAPTSCALALFASAEVAMAVPLPLTVRDRVVVDPTFATRDLVRALHRTPRHVVLVLNSGEARLFTGAADVLRPVTRGSFPMQNERPRRPAAARTTAKDADAAAFYREVDAALGTHLRLHPAPLVLVGPDRVLAQFRAVSRNLSRLAGVLDGNVASLPLPELVDRCRPVLERYLLSRQAEALALLEQRVGASRAVAGMPSAWLAARRERPEMLAVEEGLFFPARVSEDGDLLEPATDVEHPDVIDDAVDELIELVLDRGGWVALVEDGALGEHGGVALTLRTRD